MEKKIKDIFKDKKILVTGGTGTIGSSLVKNLFKYEPKVVRIFSNDEDNMFRLIQSIGKEKKRFLIGDIRDKNRLIRAMEDIDIVYHAAALKHVPLCEYNPFEAIKTNVLGTQNVIDAALKNNVDKVINISTDKAVNPINTMGATKLLAEKLIMDANLYKGKVKTIFSSVRFGNVLFSRGSVLPLFKEQIKNKKMITLTNPNMTRFMMSIEHTTDLVFQATIMAKGGEIFILKMPVVKLDDLANVAIKHYSVLFNLKPSEIQKKIIGLRPGEKLFEELMTESESKHAIETDDLLIVPMNISFFKDLKFNNKNFRKSKYKNYSSKNSKQLTIDEITSMFF